MAGYYMLSTLKHLCVYECVGIMPSDEPLPVWSPSSPSGHGERVQSKQPGGGTGQNFKIKGEPMCKFLVTLDTFVGLNG